MIALERRDGRPLRIGHRGAAALAPENTVRSFRAAREAGVDLIEFDVLRLAGGELVVAHSDDLYEVSHGAARGAVRSRSLAELREVCPELLTLDDALRFFAEEAVDVGAHADLKTVGAAPALGERLRRYGLLERALVTSVHFRALRELARREPRLRTALSFPRGMFGISEQGRRAPVARAALAGVRSLLPVLAGTLLRSSRTTALSLHYTVVTTAGVRSAHARGAPVIAWTVDSAEDLARVDEAGVDAVVTNDPAIFVSTLQA